MELHRRTNGNCSFYVDNKGLWQGTYTETYNDGDLRHVYHYLDDVLHGIGKVYYPNGQIRHLEHYKHGKRDGLTTEYDVDGRVLDQTFYKDDEYHGESRHQYASRKECGVDQRFYQNGFRIDEQVKELVEDYYNLTDEEKLMLKLKFGIDCL